MTAQPVEAILMLASDAVDELGDIIPFDCQDRAGDIIIRAFEAVKELAFLLERERCAKVAESMGNDWTADAIRSGNG